MFTLVNFGEAHLGIIFFTLFSFLTVATLERPVIRFNFNNFHDNPSKLDMLTTLQVEIVCLGAVHQGLFYDQPQFTIVFILTLRRLLRFLNTW